MSVTALRTRRTPERGTVQINSPITDQLALDFCESLDELYGYYQYETVLVRIQSPGGQMLALDYMIECIDRWREQGRSLHTEACMQANSAAALLLSLGDIGQRIASPCSTLLYHQSRLISPTSHAITATAALVAAEHLLVSNRRLMQRLCEHLVKGCGSPQAFARAGLKRIRQLRQQDAPCQQGVHPGTGADPAGEAFEKVMLTGQMQAYQEHLNRRFDEDRIMEPAEAWALMLIDQVPGSSTVGPGSEL